jgi:hypothetical protein
MTNSQNSVILISEHAMLRFRQRGPRRFESYSKDFLREQLERYLAQATVEPKGSTVGTMLSQKFKNQTVLVFDFWRFIIVDDDQGRTLVTVKVSTVT